MGTSTWHCDMCGKEYPDNESFACCNNNMADEHQICAKCMEAYKDIDFYDNYLPAKDCPACKKQGWKTDPDKLAAFVLEILQNHGITADLLNIEESQCGGAILTLSVDPMQEGEHTVYVGEVLKVGDKVEIGKATTTVKHEPEGYYLSACGRTTFMSILDILRKVDHHNLQEEILGYNQTGFFPFCKSLKDLSLYVEAIKCKLELKT